MRLSPLVLTLAVTAAFSASAPASRIPGAAVQTLSRPSLQSLVLTLDDGTSLTFSGKELGGTAGGFVVWNDFSVTQIAMDYLARHSDNTLSPHAIWDLWSPAAEADAPVAFLVTGGTLTPLGAAKPGTRTQRARLVSLSVTLSNGKSRTMPFKMLEDPINGVLVWGDDAIQATLVPYYNARPGLRSTSTTVLSAWNTMDAGGELPGTMSKPVCEPSGWP